MGSLSNRMEGKWLTITVPTIPHSVEIRGKRNMYSGVVVSSSGCKVKLFPSRVLGKEIPGQ